MDNPLQHERRSRQRFEFQLPVRLRLNGADADEAGFTQDLSARGVFLHTNCRADVGSTIELTLNMPSEITLANSMRVRCQGKVLRVTERDAVQNRIGLAIQLEGYEYLPEKPDQVQTPTDFDRIAPLHEHPFEQKSPASPARRD